MAPPSEEDRRSPAAPVDATRARLELERERVEQERRILAARLGGEDPEDPTGGDSGDQADRLEGTDDLARMDARITELRHRIAQFETGHGAPGHPDGTEVILEFPGGEVAALRVVGIVEEVPVSGQRDVVTADSPLGRTLVGCRAGETITYTTPRGRVQALVVEVRPPRDQLDLSDHR